MVEKSIRANEGIDAFLICLPDLRCRVGPPRAAWGQHDPAPAPG